MNVGLIYTSATAAMLKEAPELAFNLSDAPETIEAVQTALEAGGHTVILLNTDPQFPARLVDTPMDIAFNIATGFYGETRAAHVAAMLDYLNIPHTGSGVRAETLLTYKPIMKALMVEHGVPTPPFQWFQQADQPLDPRLRYPLIVKLPAEGGSLGMTPRSVVYNEADLREQVALMLRKYQQGALVEEFIDGREFTVSVLGNTPPYVLPIVERKYYGDIHIQLDEPEHTTLEFYRGLGHTASEPLEYTLVDSQSVAPADITAAQRAQIERICVAAYQLFTCADWARLDLRMDDAGNCFIFDVNLEPAIAPDYAVARAAYAAGWTYTQLVNTILQHAVERYPQLRKANTHGADR